jgi:hypothetical protein
MTMIFHEGIPPTLVFGVPDGMRDDMEEFWDFHRKLTGIREEHDQFVKEHEVSVVKWRGTHGTERSPSSHGNSRAGSGRCEDDRYLIGVMV